MTPKAKITSDLLAQASLFTLTQRKGGNRKKADLGRVETEADKGQLHLTKQLIESDQYRALTRYLNESKKWCLMRCMPSFIKNGVYVVRLDMIREFEVKLKADIEYMRTVLIPEFKATYPAKIRDAEMRLSDQFDLRDYPDASLFDSAFGIEWGWISFGVPDNVPKDVQEREYAKLQEKILDAEKEIKAALRIAFGELVEKAVEKLKVKPGEKPPVFRDTMIDNFTEFFQTFRARNLMDDEELNRVVGKAQEILTKITPDALRFRITIREKTAKAFEEVKREVDQLISDAPSRKFRLEEED